MCCCTHCFLRVWRCFRSPFGSFLVLFSKMRLSITTAKKRLFNHRIWIGPLYARVVWWIAHPRGTTPWTRSILANLAESAAKMWLFLPWASLHRQSSAEWHPSLPSLHLVWASWMPSLVFRWLCGNWSKGIEKLCTVFYNESVRNDPLCAILHDFFLS